VEVGRRIVTTVSGVPRFNKNLDQTLKSFSLNEENRTPDSLKKAASKEFRNKVFMSNASLLE